MFTHFHKKLPHFRHQSCSHTPSAFDALGDAAFAESEVVLVPPTATVGKRLAPLSDRVVREPPLCIVTCSGVHGNGTRVCGLQV